MSGDALIALGGNIGDVPATFAAAIAALADAGVRIVARSSNYATPPWGEPDQPDYVNACIAVETDFLPDDLLTLMHNVENRFGRDRARETRWGPRSLDLDLLAYDDVVRDGPGVILPHPRLFERAFVLVPLAEIAGDRSIAGRRVRDVAATMSWDGIRRLG